MSQLHGKVAVVTGGSSGIGLVIARRFVEEGAHVFISGRRQAELDRAVSLTGEHVDAVQGDATSMADLAACRSGFGRDFMVGLGSTPALAI